MQITIHPDAVAMGRAAAAEAADHLRAALANSGAARLIVATGASQFEVLAALIATPEIDWSRVTAFHLDEYVGLPRPHAAAFRRYLQERFVQHVPLAAFHELNGEADDLAAECRRVGERLRQRPVDVALVGIGENGHLAFNDPPADFETDEPYLIVPLDDACRQQQVGEGWFPSLADVPTHAVSMSVRQIGKARHIVCSVPDARKAAAVAAAVEGEVTPTVPASFLQTVGSVHLHLDEAAAGELSAEARRAATAGPTA